MTVPPAFENTNFPCENVPLEGGPAEGFVLTLSCVPENLKSSTRIKVIGGVPPYIAVSSQGQIVVIDTDIFEIRIDRAVWINGFFGYNSAACSALTDIPGGLSPNDPGYDPYTMSVGGNGYAFARLGLHLESKGIFATCRHHCSFMAYDCLGRPAANPTVGDNHMVIDPNACPFSDPGDPPWNTPGRGMGPCVNAHDYDLASRYPDAVYVGDTGHPSYPECAFGKPVGGIDTTPTNVANWEAAQPTALDIRHPTLIALGCSPCQLVQGSNVTITITDAILNSVIVTVPIA